MRMQGHPSGQHSHIQANMSQCPDEWELLEGMVPESRPHDLAVDLLRSVLDAWIERTGRNAQLGRNLAIRWIEQRPAIGADPDLYIVEPPPPEGDELESLCLWIPGHHPLLLAIEVVSASNTVKDYAASPDKHATAGTKELWIFDPKLRGPSSRGGPFRLQVWARDANNAFERVYAGDGPARSPVLGGWLLATDNGLYLRIAEDREGTRLWMTALESIRAGTG